MRQAKFGRRAADRPAALFAAARQMPAPQLALAASNPPLPSDVQAGRPASAPVRERERQRSADEERRGRVVTMLLDRIDVAAAASLEADELRAQLSPVIADVTAEIGLTLSQGEHDALEREVLDELIGLGPIQPLLEDPTVTDILVNGTDSIFVERGGCLERAPGRFRDKDQIMKIAQRVAGLVGRRVDRSVPLTDARLLDGSRVNIVAEPISMNGPVISIRKFAQQHITLEDMVGVTMSPRMAETLRIAAAACFNVVIAGGTGSGKTTLLNALSALIDERERIVTIEDAAELRLQKPHVVTLETRPPSTEGTGEVTIRDLLINALRMRPDRIILGEVRGSEAFDLMQAMNTGHDGSLCTIHASSAREAMTRLEHMILMAAPTLPRIAVARQLAGSIDLVVHIDRMSDGQRRILGISEVTGMDGDKVLMQELHRYEHSEAEDGSVTGAFVTPGVAVAHGIKTRRYGLEAAYRKSAV